MLFTVSSEHFRMADRCQQLIALICAGHSALGAVRVVGIPVTMGKRWASRFHVHGEVRNRAIPGRPCISSQREEIHLIRKVRNHPFLTASELKVRSNFLGSTQTARRHLRSHGIRAR